MLFFLTLLIYLLILRLFVFKTSWLIDKLHLEKGFKEERIDLNISQTTVLTIATIVVGALIFVNSFPTLCQQTFIFLRDKKMFSESQNSGWIIFHSVKTIIGYLLMTNSKIIVRFIDKQSKPEN